MACILQLDICSNFTCGEHANCKSGGLSGGVFNCNETDTGELVGCTVCCEKDVGGDSGGVLKPPMPSEF